MAKLATSSIRVKIQATEGASGKMCICVLVKSRMLTSGRLEDNRSIFYSGFQAFRPFSIHHDIPLQRLLGSNVYFFLRVFEFSSFFSVSNS